MNLSIEDIKIMIELVEKELFLTLQNLKSDNLFAPKTSRIPEHHRKIELLQNLKNKLSIELTYKQI